MKKLTLALVAAGTAMAVAGCTTIPGETQQEQVQTIEQLVAKTLVDLERQNPQTKDELSSSVGYVVMSNKITKIPFFGAGVGYGVAIDNKTQEKTYLRMSRFDFGAGWGARSVRPVLIFRDETKFHQFVDGTFEATFGAEASAKVGETGAAGGAGGGNREGADKGFSTYLITDAGVSATLSVGFIRVKPVHLKEEPSSNINRGGLGQVSTGCCPNRFANAVRMHGK
jgi:lipid-binding SYLF domain-containing protein